MWVMTCGYAQPHAGGVVGIWPNEDTAIEAARKKLSEMSPFHPMKPEEYHVPGYRFIIGEDLNKANAYWVKVEFHAVNW